MFSEAARVADLIRYTGYVCASHDNSSTAKGAGEVIVGRRAVARSARRFLRPRCRRRCPDRACRSRLALPDRPEFPRRGFQGAFGPSASERTVIERFRADFAQRLGVSSLSISQAGYNTTMDILSSGARACPP